MTGVQTCALPILKNTLEGINSRITEAEERISDLGKVKNKQEIMMSDLEGTSATGSNPSSLSPYPGAPPQLLTHGKHTNTQETAQGVDVLFPVEDWCVCCALKHSPPPQHIPRFPPMHCGGQTDRASKANADRKSVV